MDNTYYILFEKNQSEATISKFHFCTWDINKKQQYLEIGLEIVVQEKNDIGNIYIIASWITEGTEVISLHKELLLDENCSFLFNEEIKGTDSPQKDVGNWKTISFQGKDSRKIDIIQATFKPQKNIIKISPKWNVSSNNPQYIRFLIPIQNNNIATQKKGIAKRTSIYDIKINERRNLSSEFASIIQEYGLKLASISTCYILHVVPAESEIVFNSNSLPKIRCVENNAFEKYLGNYIKIGKRKYIITFNKIPQQESFSSFYVFTVEIIGISLILFTVIANILCSLFLLMLQLLFQ